MHRLSRLGQYIWLLYLALPLLVIAIPAVNPLVWVAFLLLIWLGRVLMTRQLWPGTALDVTLLVLLATLAMSLIISPDRAHSLPRAVNLVMGLLLFGALAGAAGREQRHLLWGVLALLLAGVGMAGVGLITTNWGVKFPPLAAITGRLPQLISLPGVAGGVSPNELAGVLLWVAPVALALAWGGLLYRRELAQKVGGTGRALVLWLLVGGSALFTTAILVLTQSRSGLLGLGVALVFLLAAATRLRKWLLPALGVLLIGVLVALFIVGPEQGLAFAFAPQELEGEALGNSLSLETLASRQEIWQRAWYGIQDFPLTGVGFNMFRHVAPIVYPYIQLPADFDVAHAHNQLLQAALDLGLVGLVAYLALWLGTGWMLWKSWQQTNDAWWRTLTVGLAAALLGSFIFGLTDAVALGARVGFLFWLLLGLVGGLYQWTLSKDHG